MRREERSQSKKSKKAFALLLTLLLPLFFAVQASADSLGCCSNPGAGIASCNPDVFISRDTQCCPQPASSNPQFYASAQNPNLPANPTECQTNYFTANTDCAAVSSCKSGCCCESIGGSTKTKSQCGSGAVFSEGKSCDEANCISPQCNDGVDNDNNGCADLEDSGCASASDSLESTGSCLGSGAGCTSALHSPKLSGLSIKPTKGKKQFQMSWQDECAQNALSYEISRCLGEGCTNFARIATTQTKSFTDASDQLLFDTIYTYQIKGFYSLQSATPTITSASSLGNLECFGKTTFEKFCVQTSTYLASKDYLLTNFPLNFSTANFISQVNQKFTSKLNKGFSCDTNNLLISSGVNCGSGQVCLVKSGTPSCVNKDNCNLEESKPFNLYSNQQGCEDGKYCFFDSSSTPIDECYQCDPSMSCYDYKTKGSCERDNCGLSSCQWNPISDELGLGVCTTKETNNCVWCDKEGTEGIPSREGFNKVYSSCSQTKAEKLSSAQFQCVFTGTSAKTCDQITCPDIPQANCPSSSVQFNSNNSYESRGSICGTNSCKLFGTLCKKDADADGAADCSTAPCEKDTFAPLSTITEVVASGILSRLRVDILDKTSALGEPILRTGQEYSTYLCLEPCTSQNHPFSISTTSTEILYSNRKLFEKTTGKQLLTLQSGLNTLRFYSQDPSKNVGQIKSITFNAPTSLTGPTLFNLSIPNANENQGKLFTGSLTTATAKFLEPAIITFAQLKNPATNDRYTPQFQASEGTSIILTFPSNIPDGSYILEINAKTTDGVFMSPVFTQEIVLDASPPKLLSALPLENSTTKSSPVTLTFTFEKETALLSVLIDGINLKEKFATQDNKQYSATLNLSDGNKNAQIIASSFSGVVATLSHRFVLNARPLEISLLLPPYGVSPTPLFDLSILTDNNAECRFSTQSQLDFEFMKKFQTQNGITHTFPEFDSAAGGPVKVFVTCEDPLQPKTTKPFDISVDITKPVIQSSFAFPDPIQDAPFTTDLTIQADDPVVCKYSKSSSDFNQMSPFDSFSKKEFSTLSKQNITESTEGKFSYTIICQNKAGLLSDPKTILFSSNLSIPLLISSAMPSVVNKQSVQLSIKTSKIAQCKFSQTDKTAESGTLFGSPALIHTKTILLDDGKYSFFISCKDKSQQSIPSLSQLNFTVDTLAPQMSFVDDSSSFSAFPQQSCLLDRLRVKWLGADKGTGIREYYYALFKGVETNPLVPFSKSFVQNDFIMISNITLENNAKYSFRVKAKDFVDLESEPLASDGISIDTSLCQNQPRCGDSKINAAGEECDTKTFGSVNSCTQYTNFVGGNLGCTSQCRIDTSGCQRAPSCGNGVLEPGEACDGSTFGTIKSCTSYNSSFSAGTINCTSSCKLDTSSCTQKPSCGNGVVDLGESCDGSNLGALQSSSCNSYSSSFTIGTIGCNNCQLDFSGCQNPNVGFCGDGILNSGEGCDSSTFGSINQCAQFNSSFSSGSISCVSCRLNTSSCTEKPKCGNSRVDLSESCDGSAGLGNKKCSEYANAFMSGEISCSDGCELLTGGCQAKGEDKCGDGKLDTSEICDSSNFGKISQTSCNSYSPYFINGSLNCKLCRVTTDSCLVNETGLLACRDLGECPDNSPCIDSSDCLSGFCSNGLCKKASCSDSISNQGESGIDCGGPCKPCKNGEACRENKDCEEKSCSFGLCKEASECENGILSPGEGGIDCGGICQNKCGENFGCLSQSDCAEGLECRAGSCKICALDDSDCDGKSDLETEEDDGFSAWAIKNGLDTTNPNVGLEDEDSDGLTNREEFGYETNPNEKDTDFDGYSDLEEINGDFDPNDPSSHPSSGSLLLYLFAIALLFGISGAGYYFYPQISPYVAPLLEKIQGKFPSKKTERHAGFPTLPSPDEIPLPPQRIREQPASVQNLPATKKTDPHEELFKRKHEKEKQMRESVFSRFSGEGGKDNKNPIADQNKTPQSGKIIIKVRSEQSPQKQSDQTDQSKQQERSEKNAEKKEKTEKSEKIPTQKQKEEDPLSKLERLSSKKENPLNELKNISKKSKKK